MKEAATRCGIPKRSFYGYMKDYNIEKKEKVWSSNQLINLKK